MRQGIRPSMSRGGDCWDKAVRQWDAITRQLEFEYG